ncbi:hypothetical protein CBL_01784 [Carabus blaptoides fortunei]
MYYALLNKEKKTKQPINGAGNKQVNREKSLRHDKKAKEKKTWQEFGEKMEENFSENQKLFYRSLKSSKDEKHITLKQLKDKHRKVINKENEIMKRWKEHFEELLEETQSGKGTGVSESIEHEKTTSSRERENITGNEMKNVLKKTEKYQEIKTYYC